jgi:cobalt/nickel transport system permease protein
VEGLLTALVLAYLQRSNIAVLEAAEKPASASEPGTAQKLRWLWVGLAALIVASPLGLLAPGTAWGEWGTQQLKERGLAAVPSGLEKLSGLWGAPLAGYRFEALGNASLGYLLSAVLGILTVAFVVWLFTRLITAGSQERRNPQQ